MGKFVRFNCLALMPFFLSSCTYSITMVHTEGEASDVVEESQAPSTTASPSLSIPSIK